ncbi:MAG: hypothetical protein Kow00117_11300 [Phototrophicales bacterium]
MQPQRAYEPATLTGLKMLAVLVYGGAALAIFGGFFLLPWAGRGIELSGQELSQLLQKEAAEVANLTDALSLSELTDIPRRILERYWSAFAVYFVLVLGVGYALAAMSSLIGAMMRRAVRPLGPLGRFFALINMLIMFVLNVAIPYFILSTYHDRFLDLLGDTQIGFLVVFIGAMAGGVMGIVEIAARFFIQEPEPYYPPPAYYPPPGAQPPMYPPQQYPPQGGQQPPIHPSQYPGNYSPRQPGYPPANPDKPKR